MRSDSCQVQTESFSWLQIFLLTLIASIFISMPAVALDASWLETIIGPDVKFSISNTIPDHDDTRNILVLRNYGIIAIGDRARVTARNMALYHEEMILYAEGDVVLEDFETGTIFNCEALVFDIEEWRGLINHAEIVARLQPEGVVEATDLVDQYTYPSRAERGLQFDELPREMVLRGEEVRIHQKNHQEVMGGVITPSTFAKPHWAITSDSFNIRGDEKVESWNNFLRVGNTPVFWLPYMIHDLRYDWPWFRVEIGSGNDWGFFSLIKLGIDLDPNPYSTFRLDKLYFDFDYRRRRGWAFGTELLYSVGDAKRESGGVLDLYGMYETITEERDYERAIDKNDSHLYMEHPNWTPDLYRHDGRGALQWWHAQNFTDNLDLRLESRIFTDRDFYREYFERDWKEGRSPETSADLRYNHDYFQADLYVRPTVHNWQTQSSYLPEGRFQLRGLKLGDTPIFLRGDTTLGVVNRRYDELELKYDSTARDRYHLLAGENSYDDYFRFHNDWRLYSPLHINNLAVFTPYVGARTTYYSDIWGFNADRLGDSAWNSAFMWGADLTTRVTGILNQNWRHILEPRIGYQADERPTFVRDQLLYIDQIEEYYERHFFTFELAQVFQRRTGAEPLAVTSWDYDSRGRLFKDSRPVRDVLTLTTGIDLYPENMEQKQLNNGRAFTDLRFDGVWRPTRSLSVFGDFELDTYDVDVDHASVGLAWRYRDQFNFFVSQRFAEVEEGKVDNPYSNQTMLAINTRLWNSMSPYMIELAMTYEWSHSSKEHKQGAVEERLTLRRELDKAAIEISLVRDEDDDDTSIYFALQPLGWTGLQRDPGARINASSIVTNPHGYPRTQLDYEDQFAAPGVYSQDIVGRTRYQQASNLTGAAKNDRPTNDGRLF